MTEPYFQDAFVTLYLGDCREITEWTGADVMVTDPPYGVEWERMSINSGRPNEANQHVRTNGQGIANDSDTTVRDEVLGMWGKDKPAYVFGSLLRPMPPHTRQVAIYGKPKNAGTQVCFGGVRRDAEAIYLVGAFKQTGGGRSAIFRTNARTVSNSHVGLVQRYGHPHAKPIDVLEELITVAPPGVVVDPFAGSGSTLVAARNLGRRAIGVELEERYCETIANRLRQQTLFEGSF